MKLNTGLPYSTNCIDRIEQIRDPEELTFAKLRKKYGTGRSFPLDRSYHGKNYRYRHGIQTDIGDIEESLWYELVKRLIIRQGEKELYYQLKAWMASHCSWLKKPQDLEKETLEAHASRLFDNPQWVLYIPFNEKYRPEVLETADIVWVTTDCCHRAGRVTREHLNDHLHMGKVRCPLCGVFSPYQILTQKEGEN